MFFGKGIGLKLKADITQYYSTHAECLTLNQMML